MSRDRDFARRIRRLVLTSVVALGIIWSLAVTTLDAHYTIDLALLVGWLLMPSVLGFSLRWPRLRYGLVVPAFATTLALLAICSVSPPVAVGARVGWLLITSGVLVGGVIGTWFWFRWLPVPRFLDHPYSPGRWALVAVHVCLIAAGIVVVGVQALT